MAVDALSSMMGATSGGTAGTEVAGALVTGVESLGSALMANMEVGAPPTLVVSDVLQIAVEKVEPTQLAAKPFLVPTVDGMPPKAGVGVPDNLPLPEGLASVGTVLWSSAANVRGTGGDGRRLAATGGTSLGSPTLAFALQADANPQPRPALFPCVALVPCPKAINSAYAQDDGGKEIEVKGLENGMQLKLDMFEPIDPKNTCIGKPTGKGVFESAQGGNSPCSASEVCNYFDTVKGEYSEEGCETVPTADGSMACVCDHLSEFVSLKVRRYACSGSTHQAPTTPRPPAHESGADEL